MSRYTLAACAEILQWEVWEHWVTGGCLRRHSESLGGLGRHIASGLRRHIESLGRLEEAHWISGKGLWRHIESLGESWRGTLSWGGFRRHIESGLRRLEKAHWVTGRLEKAHWVRLEEAWGGTLSQWQRLGEAYRVIGWGLMRYIESVAKAWGGTLSWGCFRRHIESLRRLEEAH